MFGFRIIDMENGDQIIDRNLKTPYNALTPLQMVWWNIWKWITDLHIWTGWNGKQGQRQTEAETCTESVI